MNTAHQDRLDLQLWEQRKGFVSDRAQRRAPSPPKPSRSGYSQPHRRYAKTKQQGRPACPACESNWVWKKGNRAEKGRPDIKRWQCADCGKRFTTKPRPEPAIIHILND